MLKKWTLRPNIVNKAKINFQRSNFWYPFLFIFSKVKGQQTQTYYQIIETYAEKMKMILELFSSYILTKWKTKLSKVEHLIIIFAYSMTSKVKGHSVYLFQLLLRWNMYEKSPVFCYLFQTINDLWGHRPLLQSCRKSFEIHIVLEASKVTI